MAKITKILSVEKRTNKDGDQYAVVTVETDRQVEAKVMVGGEIELFFDDRYNTAKAFVKKRA